MKIRFIITRLEGKESISEETLKSVNPDDCTACIYSNWEQTEALNKTLNDLDKIKDLGYTHVCIMPDKSITGKEFDNIVKDYVLDEESVYLPLVQYLLPAEKEEDKPVFKGFLNSCVWKPYGISELGILNEQLAKQQIDTTLYGAIIPIKVLEQYRFKTKIKYYSFFEYLTRLAHKGVTIKGIPKVLLHYVDNSGLDKVSQDEKVEYFKMARIEYLNDI